MCQCLYFGHFCFWSSIPVLLLLRRFPVPFPSLSLSLSHSAPFLLSTFCPYSCSQFCRHFLSPFRSPFLAFALVPDPISNTDFVPVLNPVPVPFNVPILFLISISIPSLSLFLFLIISLFLCHPVLMSLFVYLSIFKAYKNTEYFFWTVCIVLQGFQIKQS